jgi:hypothetical protein
MNRKKPLSVGFWILAGVAALSGVLSAHGAVADQCIQPDELRIETIDRSFVQERFLAGISGPLRSEGQLKVMAEKISWHMLKPFDVETVLTPSSITQSIDGGPPQPTGPEGSDLSASIARLFASLLQGHWADLQSVFHISKGTAPKGDPWSVALEPIDPQMQKILGKIEVQGCTDISRIKIDHQNGDHEVITFEPGGAPAP